MPYIELPLCIMAGYVTIAIACYAVHALARGYRMRRLYTWSGIVCMMLKVVRLS